MTAQIVQIWVGKYPNSLRYHKPEVLFLTKQSQKGKVALAFNMQIVGGLATYLYNLSLKKYLLFSPLLQ